MIFYYEVYKSISYVETYTWAHLASIEAPFQIIKKAFLLGEAVALIRSMIALVLIQ